MNLIVGGEGKKYKWHIGLATVAFTFLFHSIAFCSSPKNPSPPPQLGDRLPRISFSVNLSPEETKYLGLGQKKNFFLEDIRAKLILVDLISTHCNFCIQSIPIMNEIYETIEKDPGLRGNVKMLAIAAGATFTEVLHFKKTYGLVLPILADPEYHAHEAVGEPRVPFLIFARKDRQGRWVVVTTKVGLMGTAEARIPTYLEEDFEVERLEGDIATLENFIAELRTFLSINPDTLRPKAASP